MPGGASGRRRARELAGHALALLLIVGAPAFAGEEGAERNTDPSALRLATQRGDIYMNAVAVSPDGSLCVSGSAYDPVAVLWDLASGRQVRRLVGHKATVYTTAFTPSGDVFVASRDGIARLWSTATGEELRVFENAGGEIREAALTSDGSLVVLGGVDGMVSFWVLGDRPAPDSFRAHAGAVRAVAVSPDGSRVLTGGKDGAVSLHEIETGAEVLRFDAHDGGTEAVAFSPDEKHFLTAGYDATARLWSAATGVEERVFRGHGQPIWAARFSPDGQTVVTGSGKGRWGMGRTPEKDDDITVRLWDVATGAELRRLEGHEDAVRAIAFTPDGSQILSAGLDNTIRVWDARTGEPIRQLRGLSLPIWDLSAEAAATRLLTTGAAGTAHLWDLPTGRIRETLASTGGAYLLAVAFSNDGRLAITGGLDGPARLWDLSSGAELHQFAAGTDGLDAVALSPSGDLAATGSRDGTARVWDTATGAEVSRIECGGQVLRVLFSPDGTHIAVSPGGGSASPHVQLVGLEDGRVVLSRDGMPLCFSPDGASLAVGHETAVEIVPAGREGATRRLEGHSSTIFCGGFTADGRTLVTGTVDGEILVWDVAEGTQRAKILGHGRLSLVVPGHGRWFAAGGTDSFVRFWSLESGEELCRAIGFRDGGWAVMDAAGRYDASNGGDVEGLHWVVGNEPIALDQLKERYYDPGLLAKHLGFNEEPLREVAAFTAPKLYPKIEVDAPAGERAQLAIRLRNRGGGLGRVVVRVNGKERTADARGADLDPDAAEAELSLDLAGDPRLVPGESNRIEVLAFNAEGYLRSPGIVVDYVAPGESSEEPPELWAVVAGVSDYSGEEIDLRYAAKDAEDFATALTLAAERLFGEDRAHVTTLTTGSDYRPTRAALLEALDAVRAAKPSDLLVVYLAGHGVNLSGEAGDFHYLTADARSGKLEDPEVRKAVAISSRELTEVVKELPPLKQVLVLDTCASGRLVEKLTERRDVPGSQVRALERLKDRTGLFVLAGCASDSVSYEATRYAQGLLTHSLLLGMKGAALRNEEYVDVSTLFGFAADRVPELAQDVGGIQRPVIAAPRGASFDIGRLTEPDRAKVPLKSVRPMFLRSTFQHEEEIEDVLEFSHRVDDALRDAAAVGGEAPLVFVDARGLRGAHRLVGRYRQKGDVLHVQVRITVERKPLASFDVEGSAADANELAARVVMEALNHVLR